MKKPHTGNDEFSGTNPKLSQHGQKRRREQRSLPLAPGRAPPRGQDSQGTAVSLTLRRTQPTSPMTNTLKNSE